MASELKQKAVKGAAWLGIGQVYNQIASLVVLAILARLLPLKAFGLIGMVAVFTAFLEMFQDFGLTHAVIQRKEVTEEQLSTIFFFTVACGAVLAGLTALAGPLIAAFYHEPELATIAKLMGLGFFISSFVHVHGALMRKALDFRKLVLIRIATSLVASAVGITLAFAGFGVYALVFKGLTTALVGVILTWAAVRWRPRVRPRFASAKDMLRFGGNVTGTSFLGYLNGNMGYLLIGRFLGAASLGLYTLAFRVMLLPIRRITSQISQVAFTAFSSVQKDKPRVRRGFTQMTSKIALIAFPMMVGLLMVAPEAIPVVLGSKWLRSVFLIQVLALAGALHAVTAATWTIFRSQGKTGLHLRYEIFSTVVVLTAFAIGLRWDIEGVAVCYSIARALLAPICCRLAFGLINLSFREAYQSVRGPLHATAIMAAVVLAYRYLAQNAWALPMPTLLWSEIALGMTAYATALWLTAPASYSEALDLLRLLRAKRPSPETLNSRSD